MKYNCECCNFNTDRNDNYKVHLNSKKHFKNSNTIIETEETNETNETKETEKKNTDTKIHICEKCFSEYKTRQSLCRHRKTCNSLNKKTQNNINKLVNELREEIKELKKEKESKNITIYNTTNNIQNTTNNIVIVPYVDTDIEHITDNEFKKVIKKNHMCVKELVSKKHFNKDKPEFMNLAVTNVRDEYMLIYRDGWGLTKKKDMIETIFSENELTIEDKVKEFNDPILKDIFNNIKNIFRMM
jgi:hypothetical protein